MQIQFKSTNRNADTHCCICGQGFVLSWEREPRTEYTEILFEIQKTLCNHHRNHIGSQPHPPSGLLVSEWKMPLAASGAMIGHAQACAH
jgi:hypothetical protein